MLNNFIQQNMALHLDSKITQIGNTEYSYTEYSYSVFLKAAQKNAQLLKEKIPSKRKCAIICGNQFYTALSILSAWQAELVSIPISMNYGQQRCYDILDVTKPDLIIIDDHLACKIEGYPTYNISQSKFLTAYKDCGADQFLSDAALIMCTSGTTGKPKGIVLTETGIIENTKAIKQYFLIDHDDRILISRPLCHSAVLTGELLISLINGLDIFFCDNIYSPQRIIENCKKHSITVTCGTPTLFRHVVMLLKSKNDVLNLNTIVLSGEQLTLQLARTIRNCFIGVNIYHVYGLTEASPRVSYLPPKLFDLFPNSVGFPLSNAEIKIVDSDGFSISASNHGNIIIKSTSLMKGYYNNRELTDNIIRDGWLWTGDIGYIDEDKKLYILSRADDLIIKAGMNIYPSEIENIVNRSEEISECIAYGYWVNESKSVAIDVVLSTKYKNMTIKDLKLLLSSLLPQYLVPTKVRIVDSFPQTVSGKTIRSK